MDNGSAPRSLFFRTTQHPLRETEMIRKLVPVLALVCLVLCWAFLPPSRVGAQAPQEKAQAPRFPKLETQLSDLVEQAMLQTSSAARERIAARAPVRKGTTVAVSIRVTDHGRDL